MHFEDRFSNFILELTLLFGSQS